MEIPIADPYLTFRILPNTFVVFSKFIMYIPFLDLAYVCVCMFMYKWCGVGEPSAIDKAREITGQEHVMS